MYKRRIVIPAALVILGLAAWLAFGYFGVATLWTDDKVDEAAPAFASGTTATPPPPDSTDGTDQQETAASIAAGAPYRGTFVDRSHPTSGTALVLQGAASGELVLRLEDFKTDNGPDLNVYLSAAPADAEAGAFDYDYIDLGDLKGNVGNQNYDIPLDADLEKYKTVVVWCVRFDVAFGAAELAAV